ncbi:MAG: tetratricopeptide repeat protein, partial [Elusimicrobiaceae bacterium]|nr:tetratricopeptide repeat protein [Elusimicrobiaceae bacterium]
QAYDLAVTGFKLYIEQYPEGENIEQAYIYMGDAYFAQEQAKPAAIAYATVLQKFPESKIIPTARLKYARSIIPLGKTEEAKRYFSSVVQDFGSSPEARLAKEELAKLK